LGWRELPAKLRREPGVTLDVALFCLGFALLRAWSQHGKQPVQYPDTPSYMPLNFLGHGVTRLWTTPLLFTILPSDSARVYAQLLIGIACWSALALGVARSLAHPVVARVGGALILVLGLCEQVTEWDTILLSESLALSLTALLVASLLWLRLRPTRWGLGATLVVMVLWVFSRQLHAAVFIPVAIVAIGWILLRRRRLIGVAVALAAIAAWGGYATVASGKAIVQMNAHDILVLRILKSPQNADYFARRGMPKVAVLKKEASTETEATVFSHDRGLVLNDPQWKQWIDAHWRTTYAGWLLRHPVATVRGPADDAPVLLSGLASYASVLPALPGPIQDTLWDRVKGATLPCSQL